MNGLPFMRCHLPSITYLSIPHLTLSSLYCNMGQSQTYACVAAGPGGEQGCECKALGKKTDTPSFWEAIDTRAKGSGNPHLCRLRIHLL